MDGGRRGQSEHNLRTRVFNAAVMRADKRLIEGGESPLPVGVSPHKARHSFASLLVALGEDPGYVMDQLGHTNPNFTLKVYRHGMRRGKDEKDRLRTLVAGEALPTPARILAPTGTSAAEALTQEVG